MKYVGELLGVPLYEDDGDNSEIAPDRIVLATKEKERFHSEIAALGFVSVERDRSLLRDTRAKCEKLRGWWQTAQLERDRARRALKDHRVIPDDDAIAGWKCEDCGSSWTEPDEVHGSECALAEVLGPLAVQSYDEAEMMGEACCPGCERLIEEVHRLRVELASIAEDAKP